MAVKIKVNRRIIPMIYAYTTPEIARHDGWIKIGYTDKQTVEERVKQQTHTADVKAKIEWKGNARYQDGSDELFTDHEFHEYLVKRDILNVNQILNGSKLIKNCLDTIIINLQKEIIVIYKVKVVVLNMNYVKNKIELLNKL